MVRSRIAPLAAAVLVALGLAGAPAQAGARHPAADFVTRSGTELRVAGKPFRFAGTDN